MGTAIGPGRADQPADKKSLGKIGVVFATATIIVWAIATAAVLHGT
jgi:hypothetical protein